MRCNFEDRRQLGPPRNLFSDQYAANRVFPQNHDLCDFARGAQHASDLRISTANTRFSRNYTQAG